MKSCATCGCKLGKPNKSGYCRKHFARSIHDNPEASEQKRLRHEATWAVHPHREALHRRLARMSRARMAWCPLEYRDLYRKLRSSSGFGAAEARTMIVRQVALDNVRSLTRPGR